MEQSSSMDSAELECRVCRSGPEEDNPLYTPCLCSGSIGLVHQECLEAWLKHSKKENCELCSAKYQFAPQYAENTPTKVPLLLIVKSIVTILLKKVLPLTARGVLVSIIWLGFVPIATTCIYCACIGRKNILLISVQWSSIVINITNGIVIDAVIALSLLVLIAFFDFLRFHWLPQGHVEVIDEELRAANGNNRPANNNNRNDMNDRNNNLNQRVNHLHEVIHRMPQPVDEHGQRRDFNRLDMNELNIDNEDLRLAGQDNREHDDSLSESSEFVNMTNFVALEDFNDGRNSVSSSDESDSDDNNYDIPIDDPVNDENQNNNHVNNINDNNGNNINANNNNNINNNENANDNNMDFFDIDPEEGQEVGLEVRIALFELLGLDGPYHVMIKNSLFLLGFTALYLTALISLPYLIGRLTPQIFESIIDGVLERFSKKTISEVVTTLIPSKLLLLLELIQQFSIEKSNPIQLYDIFYVTIGFNFIFLFAYTIRFIGIVANKLINNRIANTMLLLSNRAVVVVKVGVLLLLRIFVLPVFEGALISLVSASVLFGTKVEDWADFLSSNMIGALSLAWVVGITFMLTVTISVLQLREVLHPDYFAKLIRPQEAHAELINSLINEGELVHCRRILISMLVYLFLLATLVWCPLLLCNVLMRTFALYPYAIKLWYVVPEIQLPLELLLGHITFLSVLDKHKDLIGRFQHLWLVMLSKHLGLTRFIIPLPMIKQSKRRTHKRQQLDSNNSICSNSSGDDNGSNNKSLDNEIYEKLPNGESYTVGSPLPRPPVGWDVRTANNSSRWAFGTEEPSEVEKMVAPRVIPTYWFLRLVCAIAISILLLNTMTVALLVVPLALGKYLFSVFCFPIWLQHDPLILIVGMSICAVVGYYCFLAYSYNALEQWKILSQQRYRGTITKVVQLTLMWVAVELAIGMIVSSSFRSYHTISVISDSGNRDDSMNSSSHFLSLSMLFSYWIQGTAVVHITLDLLCSESFGPIIINYFGLTFLQNSIATLKQCYNRIVMAIMMKDWSSRSLRLDTIENVLVKPLFKFFVLIGMSSTIIIYYLRMYLQAQYGMNLEYEVTIRQWKLSFSFIPQGLFYYLFIISFLSLIISKWSTVFYNKIRDDNYLIGRKLQNSKKNTHIKTD